MTVLSLRFCARAFSSCGKWGPLFIAVRGPLTIAASLVAEHRLQTRRLSNCGSQAQSLRGTCDPPRPGLEPVSPALAGRLSTTVPPGKPPCLLIEAFSPFTFKVIIDRYVLIAILFIVFGSLCNYFLFLSSFVLFPCDFMTIFSVIFGFLISSTKLYAL